MTTTISFLIVLGILIFIHELGHFTVAKFVGVGVEKFSLGFGPKLIAVTKGETEYRLSLLPLGGYVKMVGEGVDDEVSEQDKARSFTHKPIASRMAIVAAGPIMNLILAFILFPTILLIGVKVPAYIDKPVQVGYVIKDGPAFDAGLVKGDVIKEVNGVKVATWMDLPERLALNGDAPVALRGSHADGSFFEITLKPEKSQLGGAVLGFVEVMKPTIASVSKGYPAYDAGLKSGDTILAIDGVAITHWQEMVDIIHEKGEQMDFLVMRNGAELVFKIKPQLDEKNNRYLVGITPEQETVFKRYGLFPAIAQGFRDAIGMISMLFSVIKGLILGQFSLKAMGGPIMIAQVAGVAARMGIVPVLKLLAALSLQLGIINLFPIPVLDGGHLVFFGIEFARGKPLSDRIMGFSQQVGFGLIIILMVLVTYNDIFRLFS